LIKVLLRVAIINAGIKHFHYAENLPVL